MFRITKASILVRSAVILMIAAMAMVGGLSTSALASDFEPGAPLDGRLDEQEIADILLMREEEKLARDVYLALGEQWDLRIFTNISMAEQQHMNSVLTLIEDYGLEDPVGDHPEGVFTNPDLQALYDQLVSQGQASVGAALKVGGAIEEIDILDLEAAFARTDHDDIRLVYSSLECGSDNHLRAFVRTLKQQTGETYAPQYLDQAAYDAILAGSQGPCSMSLRYYLPLTLAP